jgi:hypothetical protein
MCCGGLAAGSFPNTTLHPSDALRRSRAPAVCRQMGQIPISRCVDRASIMRTRNRTSAATFPPAADAPSRCQLAMARILRFAERPLRAQPVKHQDPDLAISCAVSFGSRHLLVCAGRLWEFHSRRLQRRNVIWVDSLAWNLVGLAAQSKRFFMAPECWADMRKQRLMFVIRRTYRDCAPQPQVPAGAKSPQPPRSVPRRIRQ